MNSQENQKVVPEHQSSPGSPDQVRSVLTLTAAGADFDLNSPEQLTESSSTDDDGSLYKRRGPRLAINHPAHPPQWHTEGTQSTNVSSLNASRSEVSTITWVSNYWWMKCQRVCPSGQRHTVGLHVAAECREEKRPRAVFTSVIICLNRQLENISAFIRSESACSADRVKPTGSCGATWPVHTNKHSTPQTIQPSVSNTQALWL